MATDSSVLLGKGALSGVITERPTPIGLSTNIKWASIAQVYGFYIK